MSGVRIVKCSPMALLICVVAGFIIGFSCKDISGQDSDDINSMQIKQKPIIIWFHNGATDPPEALTTALSSGLINHVMIHYMHRADADWRTKRDVVEAIEIVKKSGAKLIWVRDLWPYYNNKGIRTEILFDPNYYIREIQVLRSEAAQMGADFVAIDTEAYGDSPIMAYEKKKIALNASDIQRVNSVIKDVIKTTGKIDFILPEGWPGNGLPHDILAELAVHKISEGTYYSNYIRIKGLKTPYDIFGAYLNTERENPKYPELPFFTIKQIFEESRLWSDKKGLFLYPKEDNVLAVSKQLAAYGKSLPRVNLAVADDVNKTR